MYFFAMEMTRRRLASTISVLARSALRSQLLQLLVLLGEFLRRQPERALELAQLCVPAAIARRCFARAVLLLFLRVPR